jgi:hypothetical protein
VAQVRTDHQEAVDLRSSDDGPLAFFRFRDGGIQWIRAENDPSPMHFGHRGEFSARTQMKNFAAAFGLPLSS